MPKSNVGDSVFNAYYSKYPQSLELESQINVPRPCAFTSVLLPELVEYYRGSEAVSYPIYDTRFGYVLTQLKTDYERA